MILFASMNRDKALYQLFGARFNRWHVVFLSIAILLANAACVSVTPIYYEDDKSMALERMAQFHTHFNNGEYDDAFELFTPNGRSNQTVEGFSSQLRSFREVSGNFLSHEVVSEKIQLKGNFRIVNYKVRSKFEKIEILEEFDFIVEGESAHIDFYGQPKE